MIRHLKSGGYRIYSRGVNPRTGHRCKLGTYRSLEQAGARERQIQYFKRLRGG